MATARRDDLPVLPFESAAVWRAWLEANHDSADGVWLKIAKKASGIPTVSYGEAVEQGLCFGWIDSLKGSLDDRYYVQRFTPRRPKGLWSKVNREKVEALIAAKQMHPAGMREVDAAQADGRWDAAYDGAGTAEPHPDLVAALAASPAAERFFATLSGANRYAVTWRVQTARTDATRAKRIAQLVAMLERGETLH